MIAVDLRDFFADLGWGAHGADFTGSQPPVFLEHFSRIFSLDGF